MRHTIALNRRWEFTKDPEDGFFIGKKSNCETVELPHTVCETPLNYFDEHEYQMISGYRRTITLPENACGKRVFLHIGAAAHYAEVYVDGKSAGVHKGGYTAFCIDLTEMLKPGVPSVLGIMVDSRETLNIPPFGHVIDYMTYGGLYREVWLKICEESCIEDVFAIPTLPEDYVFGVSPVEGRIETRLRLHNADGMKIRLKVTDDNKTLLVEKTFSAEKSCLMTVPDIKPWDIDSPVLYTLCTELLKDDEPIDNVVTRIGFRKSEFHTDGYYLNGRRIKIRGLNRHQSYPYVGYAMPRSMQRLDADILKSELGLNSVRTSHYPQSQHFIERCDELGLLVFTEIPGWQHIGDDEWKETAVMTTREMVEQYRNHPSVILWGVRINESRDDDEFYARTNAAAHELDPTRPTGGVRYIKKSSLLEDVYTYNDFSHDGKAHGCEKKKNVTSDMAKPYLISEYCGHMYPTKSFDNEEIFAEHALRHARVLNAAALEQDICGSFGWCFFDYNTHRDFGSGDRICYHGVCDMFRNSKLAAAVYSSQSDATPVLEISSDMNIGEHPASVRGRIFAFTNADSVRFYKNGEFISELHPCTEFSALDYPPKELDDLVGERIKTGEGFSEKQATFTRDILNDAARFGMNSISTQSKLKAAWLIARYRMSFEDAYRLYGKYIENWGDSAAQFRFEAIKDGRIVKTVTKEAFTKLHMEARVSHTELIDGDTYDAALIRLRITDQNMNTLRFYFGTVKAKIKGCLCAIGPENVPITGGMGGLYVKTIGKEGRASVTLSATGCEDVTVSFNVSADRK